MSHGLNVCTFNLDNLAIYVYIMCMWARVFLYFVFELFSKKRREKEKNFQKKTKKKKRKRKKNTPPRLTTHGPSHESTHEYTTQQTTPPELHRCFPSSLSSGRHERIDRELGLGPAGAPLVGREASHRPTPGRSPSIARLLGSALDALS